MIFNVNKRKVLSVFMLFFCFLLATAQLTDLARLEYSFIPKSNSDDNYTRLRLLFNYPIKVKEDTYFIFGAEYNRIILNLEDDYPFNTSLLETINVIDVNVGYTFKTNKKWRLGVKLNPRIASTLKQKITIDDFFINGGVYAIQDRTKDESLKKPYRLILGLTYNASLGVPFPLPLINYYRRVNDKWSFSAGVPKSNIKHYFNKKNTVQAFVSLDGYFAHLQSPALVIGKQVKNISLSVAVFGTGYEYCFTKHLVAYAYAGYTFRLNNVLRDKTRNVVYKLDDKNAFYFRSGLKFKL